MKHHFSNRLHASSESGIAIVELALVLPLLLAILLGIFDFGRALNYWNDANQMAATGARFAAVNRNPGGTTDNFQNWLRKQADTGELYNGSQNVINPVRVCVRFRDTNGDAIATNVGDAVEVEVSAKYGLLPLVDRGTSVNLIGKATMRLEQKATNVLASNNPPQCT
jgi:Flp pilus assembly protein TadG